MRTKTLPNRIGVVTAFPPGRNSLNEFGFHLVRHLASSNDVEEVVVFADKTDRGKPLAIAGVRSQATWSFNSWSNPFRIVQAIRRANVDAVLVNLQFATFGDRKIPGGLGLLTPLLLARLGIPTGVILHNLVENVDMEDAGFAGNAIMARLMGFAGRLLTRAILQADYVALTIPRYVEFLQEQYHATNAILTPHGAFEAVAEPSFGLPDRDTRRILAFGKFGTYKKVEVLVEAFRELQDRGYDDIELVIAGTDSPNAPAYLAGIEALCADVPEIIFTGYVAEEEVGPLFRSAAITAFPYTSTTGSSGVLHQAGSYGRAAVLPAIGDFAEVIEEEGFIGLYFEPDDSAGLADALMKYLDNNQLVADHGRANFLASVGIPIAEIVDWHLIHLKEAAQRHIRTTPEHRTETSTR